jgi:hypothetical protein
LNLYESRYCTFAAPNDWVTLPPFGFAGPGDEEDRFTAQAMERFLTEPTTAGAYAQKQIEVLPALYAEMALVAEGPQPVAGAGDGYFLLLGFRNEEGDRALARVVYLTLGPLVCELTLIGLDGTDRERDRLFEAIGKTFALHDVEFLTKVDTRPLLAKNLDLSAPPPGERRKFPRCCVSIPLLSGWEMAEEDGAPVFRLRGTEIRLRRVLGSDGDVKAWLADRMKALQETKSLLLGSERGSLERGDYAALLYEEKGAVRSWNTAAVRRTLDVFLAGEQPLLLTLETPVAGFDDYRPALESLLSGAEFLPAAEWETKLAEPWIDLTLKGPWRTEGPGLYACTEPVFTFLYLTTQKEQPPVEKVQTSIVESVRTGSGVQEIFAEKKALGPFRGHESLHYSVEGFAPENDYIQGTRTVWVSSRGILHGGMVWGPDSHRVETLHRQVVEALRVQ